MKSSFLSVLSVILLGSLLVAGCQKRISTEDIAEQAAPPSAAPMTGAAEAAPGDASEGVTAEDIQSTSDARRGGSYASLSPGDELTAKAREKGQLFTIYFDYDTYAIRDADMDNLTRNARWLGINPYINIRVEGHADERGETDYNLALGDKRARSVKKYLEDMGIGVDRVEVVSYGEEKPAVQGQDENAWSRNRRAEFVIISN